MSNTRKPRNGAELLKSVQPKLARDTANICLRPDLLNEYNQAVIELDRLRDEGERLAKEAGGSKGGRLASAKTPDQVENEQAQRKQAEKVRGIEDRMAKFEVPFEFEAMDKDKWRDLCDSNPPREGNQIDLYTGYNRDVVLDEAVRPSLMDPEFDDCDDNGCEHADCYTWQYLVRLLNFGQWNRMRDTAERVNNGVAEVPKSKTASDILSRVAAESTQPSPSESVPAASRAGSRKRSTTTTTPTESS